MQSDKKLLKKKERENRKRKRDEFASKYPFVNESLVLDAEKDGMIEYMMLDAEKDVQELERLEEVFNQSQVDHANEHFLLQDKLASLVDKGTKRYQKYSALPTN
ncbi:hypothetical protein L1987_53886 [Smallanthus sonchifolius]|uniref:Uncharacterized protein n=1 Tax=Smallanthus sonchifolius TaxID=185202 RepID=A0ACB9EX49_9ASTR|nr:hypothetical protein L1987_53886 [Smallanthus sonchifolius]